MAASRRRLLAAAAALAVLLAVFAVAAARSRTPACTLPAPVPELTPQLRALGDLDQPFDAARVDQLDDAASRAAAATGVDLGGATAERPVVELATGPARYDAVVVPLTRREASGRPAGVVGLVAFLRDCSGQLYYDATDDLSHNRSSATLPASYPALDAASAALRLGAGSPLQLVYSMSPFRPEWRDPGSGRTVEAA
ncbi:MAG: hypothetical protein NVSMB29_17760 [Candidatus Dormibacteria bacterium]